MYLFPCLKLAADQTGPSPVLHQIGRNRSFQTQAGTTVFLYLSTSTVACMIQQMESVTGKVMICGKKKNIWGQTKVIVSSENCKKKKKQAEIRVHKNCTILDA